jgi:hypothetical protein
VDDEEEEVSHLHTTTYPQPDLALVCVEVRPERDIMRVVPVGERDLATGGELEAQLHELLHPDLISGAPVMQRVLGVCGSRNDLRLGPA